MKETYLTSICIYKKISNITIYSEIIQIYEKHFSLRIIIVINIVNQDWNYSREYDFIEARTCTFKYRKWKMEGRKSLVILDKLIFQKNYRLLHTTCIELMSRIVVRAINLPADHKIHDIDTREISIWDIRNVITFFCVYIKVTFISEKWFYRIQNAMQRLSGEGGIWETEGRRGRKRRKSLVIFDKLIGSP